MKAIFITGAAYGIGLATTLIRPADMKIADNNTRATLICTTALAVVAMTNPGHGRLIRELVADVAAEALNFVESVHYSLR